ncbi:MAG TPA: penicillin-binding transpeptidase domain-containing protein [Lachnospiraceae bacterium]|nr:penicillin-binding transpeptidase domain-containing protein [Lachnospiraceae bacterium]
MNTRMRRSREKKIKPFTTKMQAKTLLVFCVVMIILFILIGRLVFINNVDGERYAKRVLSQQTYSSNVIPYKRGDIVDRNDTVLATCIKVYNLIIDPKNILESKVVNGEKTYPYKEATLQALSKYIDLEEHDLSEEQLNQILTDKPDSRYIRLIKQMEYSEIEDLMAAIDADDSKIRGVWFEEEYKRTYPYNSVASDLIGFTSSGNVGNYGIEEYYNNDLNGSNGREYGYFDNELNLERTVKPAVDGDTIVSTIDLNIQTIVEDKISTFMKDIGAKNTAVLVMDPSNGEVLAMASDKQFDLNKPFDLTKYYSKTEIDAMSKKKRIEALFDIWRNFCVSDAFEPGSTYKPFVIAAALEEGIIKDGDHYYCDGKEVVVEGQKPVRCVNRSGHGDITVEQAIMYSCNDTMVQVSKKMGRSLMYKYQREFGFGSKTGIDLPGEGIGLTFSEENLNPMELATSSFGQGATETMIQMGAAFSTVINGGYYYTPHVVKKIRNADGATIENIEPTLDKQVISNETSELLKRYLFNTVEEGTATTAGIKGYEIGGKTGTAQKQPRDENHYLVSFIGFSPIENPKVMIYVIVDQVNDPNGDEAHSSYAQQLAHDIMNDILPFLGVLKSNDSTTNQQDANNQGQDTNTQDTNAQNTDVQDNTQDGTKEEIERDGTEQNDAESTDSQNDTTEDDSEENDTENYSTIDDENTVLPEGSNGKNGAGSAEDVNANIDSLENLAGDNVEAGQGEE